MQFSEQQKQVIGARDTNLLVFAAAGSGKTTVLVERVLGLLGEGVNIDEILIVTFTKAASEDMKQKFYRRLSLEAENGSRRMYEQLERLEFSSISTLHAFCSKLIRQNFELLGIDPNFRVLDDAENSLIIERELNDVMEDAYARPDEGFARLSEGRSDETLREMVLEMYKFISQRPDADAWFASTADACNKWIKTLETRAHALLRDAISCAKYALSLARMPSGPLELAGALEKDIGLLEGLCELGYEEMRTAINGLAFARAGKKKAGSEGDIDLSETAGTLRERMKAIIKKQVQPLVSLPLELALEDIKCDAPARESLFSLAKELGRRTLEARREKAALTFNDLEHFTIQLIKQESVREKLRLKYRYVFVDEYQDTSDIQEEIVGGVAKGDNLFMVGDVKQSIYRFRNAVPELFMSKSFQYKRGDGGRLIALSTNYRSRESVIDFINLLFARVMSGGESEIEYDEDARLYCCDSKKGGEPVELIIIHRDGEAGEDEDEGAPEPAYRDGGGAETEDGEALEEEELKDAELEATLIARRINEMKTRDESLRNRDFCVLTRVKRNVLAQMAAVLASHGIPSYADETDSALDALEVATIINALKLLINRGHEIELLSVLRSPMCLLSSTDLARIRVKSPDGTLWQALIDSKDDMPAVNLFLEIYEGWRTFSKTLTLNALIRRIVDDTGFYGFVGALPGGRHRQANIDLLCQLAMEYEAAQGRSLSGFLEHMARLKTVDDGGGAHELGESDDVVRLMSAHKSKGLEFKVVFASMLARAYGLKGAGDYLSLDKELGLAFPHMDAELGSQRPTLATKAIAARRKQMDTAEELRILYVTLTRAQERLILTGTVKELQKALTNWKMGAESPRIYRSSLDITASAAMGCPGGEALGGKTITGAPRIRLSLVPACDIKAKEGTDVSLALKNIDRLLASDAWDKELESAYKWEYPERDRSNAPLKLAVTGLERELTGGDGAPRLKLAPAFISGEDKSVYTQRGTAVHCALQNLEHAPFRDISDIFDASREAARQLNLMADRGILQKEERALVKPGVIAGFMLSDVGRRLLRSDTVRREWRFTLVMPLSRVAEGYAEGDEIIVQGSVDLCFIEGGQWVLVDYKTDRCRDEDELIARYGTQLDIYAEALETLTQIKVKQALICLVSDGRAIEVSIKRGQAEG